MYIKSVDGFLYDMDHDPDSAVYRVLRETTAASDQSSEQRSWAKSLPRLAKVLSPLPAAVRSGCQIVLEAKYESEERRADVVLVGTQQGRPSLLIIENKRWSNLDRYRPDGQHSVWDPYHNCMTCHPARQVEHYKMTLEYHNQFVQDSDATIRTMVFLQNATLAEKQAKSGPFAERYRALYPQTPMFTGEETAEMTAFIAGCFDGCSDTGLAQQIYSSPVRDSSDYRLLLENWSCRRKQLLDELDEEQIALFDEISQVVWAGNERRVFLVHGKRGTGKTFVAIALLAYLYRSRGMQIRYLERNRDPRKILETYFEVPWWAMGNLPENVPNNCDCLICDESHRF